MHRVHNMLKHKVKKHRGFLATRFFWEKWTQEVLSKMTDRRMEEIIFFS